MTSLYIEKATGEKERFSRKKLERSLHHAGASQKVSANIARRVGKRLRTHANTQQIHHHALTCLAEEHPTIACRYHLKEAIYKLGPSGYPFEDYIGAVLATYGYDTTVGTMVSGACIRHEVDVIALKGKERAMVECKFHGNRGQHTDVRVPLYIYARFLDVQKRDPAYTHAWIVTNTRFTTEAIRYATCVRIRLVGWKYPVKGSLERLVEEKLLYPITIFPWLNAHAVQGLITHGFVLAKDIVGAQGESVRRAGQMSAQQGERLLREAELLFS